MDYRRKLNLGLALGSDPECHGLLTGFFDSTCASKPFKWDHMAISVNWEPFSWVSL